MKISCWTIITKHWWKIIIAVGLISTLIWGINAWIIYRSPEVLSYPTSLAVKEAQALYTAGDLSEAKTKYQEIIQNHPNDYVAVNGLGNILRDQNDYSGAEEMYLQAINIYPRYEFAYRNLLSIYQMWPKEEQPAKLQIFGEVIKKGLRAGPRSGNILGTALSYYQLIGDAAKVSELEARLAKLPLKSSTIE
ncbi:tetratricopeptide repeat protein [Patescibacteria group bacterium]|nr:tetratricopeptide repeat protein [Patescibacteria group bacterium]